MRHILTEHRVILSPTGEAVIEVDFALFIREETRRAISTIDYNDLVSTLSADLIRYHAKTRQPMGRIVYEDGEITVEGPYIKFTRDIPEICDSYRRMVELVWKDLRAYHESTDTREALHE